MEGAYLCSPLVAEDGDRAAPGDSADVVPALAAHEAADSRLSFGHDLVQGPRSAVHLRLCPCCVLAELQEVGRLEPTRHRRYHTGHAGRGLEAGGSLHAFHESRLLLVFLLGLFFALALLFLLLFGLELTPGIAVHRLTHLQIRGKVSYVRGCAHV